MSFLYYIPARRFPGGRVPDTLKGEALAGMGLPHLVGAPMSFRAVRNNGPDGGAGLCIGLNTPANVTGVFPDQTWQPVNGGDLFVGWADAKPGPELFERRDALPATDYVTLADGNAWGFVATKALPEVMALDSTGQMCWKPRAQDLAHYEASKWLMDYLISNSEQSYIDVLTRIAACLEARYYIAVPEMLALGLFSTDLHTQIVCACVGIDYADLNGKKNETA